MWLLHSSEEVQMFIDYQTLIIIILTTFIIGFMMGVRFVRPRYDRYDR